MSRNPWLSVVGLTTTAALVGRTMTNQRRPKIKALFVNNAIRLVRAVTYTVLGLIAASAVPTPEGDMARDVVSSYALVRLLALLPDFGNGSFQASTTHRRYSRLSRASSRGWLSMASPYG